MSGDMSLMLHPIFAVLATICSVWAVADARNGRATNAGRCPAGSGRRREP
jgi:hypothetical protein